MEKNCGNCKHWNENKAIGNYERICDAVKTQPLLQERKGVIARVTFIDSSAYQAALVTRAEFSCSLFEEKEMPVKIHSCDICHKPVDRRRLHLESSRSSPLPDGEIQIDIHLRHNDCNVPPPFPVRYINMLV